MDDHSDPSGRPASHAPRRTASLRLITRFAIAGSGSTLVYFLLANILTLGANWAPATASISAYLAALGLSYLAQSRFVFRAAGDSARQIARFLASSAIGLGLSYGVIRLAVDGWGVHPALGTAAVCVLIPVVNFILFSRWVFGR